MSRSKRQFVIEATPPQRRADALRCLHLGRTQIARMLQCEQLGELNMDGLFQASRLGRLVGAAWGQILPGRMGSCWPASIVKGEAAETAVRLQAAVDSFLDSSDVTLIQAVVDRANSGYARQLKKVGYRQLADLAFLIYELDLAGPPPAAPDLTYEVARPDDRSRLRDLVDRTYLQTLDCSELDELRDTDDVLTGYRQTGLYRPEWWVIVRNGDQDIGCILMADHPTVEQCELLYMGVVPEQRGQGRGLELARYAQQLARAGSRHRLTVAVDDANWPAKAIYMAAGFQQWDTRCVLVRLPTLGHSGS